MRITKKARLIMLVAMAFVAVFALSVLGGCNNDKAGVYYLSVYDNGAWTTYKSSRDVPAANKLVADSADSNVYHLTIDLDEGAKVRIAQVGTSVTYGWTEVFSELTALSSGSDNAMVVSKAGKFELSLDVSAKEITYKFTAKTTAPPDGGDPDDPADEKEALLVEIDDVSGSVTLTYPQTKTLTATVTFDDESSSHEVTWSSSETGVATVANGVVTPVSAGVTQIKAHYGDELESDPLTVYVVGTATIETRSYTIAVDEEKTIEVTLAGGATKVQWTSSDEDVATVDDNGVVKGVTPGTANVTFFYLERPDTTPKSIVCSVTVSTPVEDIALASSLSVSKDATQNLVVTFVPANASNQNYTHNVVQDDNYISVVKNGNTLAVTGLKEGTATITVVTEEGSFTKSCTVTVVDADSEFANEITPQTLTIDKSGTGTLTVSGSGIASVTWRSSAESIVKVVADTTDSKKATVTGAGFGTATITAEISFASGNDTTKTVDVLVSPEQMWLYGDLIEGSSGWDLTGTYEDAAARNLALSKQSNGVFSAEVHLLANRDFRIAHNNFDWKGIRYEHLSSVASEKEYVIQGGNDQNGNYNVKVTKAGTYLITVDLTNGKAVLKIQCVSIDVTNVSVATDESTLTSNGEVTSAEITLTVTPADATYGEDDIKWTLTNESLVDKVLSNENKTITITVKNDLQEGGTVRVTVSLKGKTAYVDITIVAAGAAIVPVDSIAFEQSSYSFNVNNNGSFNGNGTVVAKVNSDATNQGVTYSAEGSGISIDSATGVITATEVGTYTITATAAGDPSKTDTCTVTFYSNVFYLSGAINGWGVLADVGTTIGSNYENYTFTANDDNTIFTLENVALTSDNLNFAICYCGSTGWNGMIANGATYTGMSYASNSGNSSVSSAGLYKFVIDISSTTTTITATRTGDIPTYTAALVKDSESVATSGNSEVLYNRYAMTLQAAFVAEAEYSIQVGESDIAVTAISSTDSNKDIATLFTLSEGKLTCVAAGNYRLTVSYNPADSSCTVAVEVLVDSWASSTVYTLKVYSGGLAANEWPTYDVTVTLYYNSVSSTYEMYFAYELKGVGEEFSFGLCDASGTWKADIKPSGVGSVTGSDTTKINPSSLTGGKLKATATGTVYFKIVFSDASGYTFSSMVISDEDLNTRA